MTEDIKRKISTIGSRITSIISVALVLLIIGVVMTTAIITGDSGSDMRRHVGMVVKMYPGAGEDDVASLRSILTNSRFIRSAQYISAENVLAEERSYNGELLSLIGSNPYSAEFEVYLHPQFLNSDSINMIASMLELEPTVEEVYAQPDIVDNMNDFIRTLNVYLMILGVVMLIISVTLIYNVVSLSVYTRRFVINTMKLVGATDAYICKPFVISGVITGTIAAVIAFALLCVVRVYSATLDNDLLFVVSAGQFVMIFFTLLALGVALCVCSVYLATRRCLRASFDDLVEE